MEEAWVTLFSRAKKKLEDVQAFMNKSKIKDPITADLLQNLIDTVAERLKKGHMINCTECLYVAQSEQALVVHQKMVHY